MILKQESRERFFKELEEEVKEECESKLGPIERLTIFEAR
jgi:hypothetical protein